MKNNKAKPLINTLISLIFAATVNLSCTSSSEIAPLDEELSLDSEVQLDEISDLDFDTPDLDSNSEFNLDDVEAEGEVAESTSQNEGDADFDNFDDFDDTENDASSESLADSENVEDNDNFSFDEFDEPSSEVGAGTTDAVEDSSDDFDDFTFDDEDISLSDESSDGTMSDKDSFSFEDPSFEQPQTSTGPVNISQQQNRVLSVDYFSTIKGGAFEIQTSQNPDFETEFVQDTNQFILKIKNAKISKDLKRPFLTKDFKQSFNSMSSYQDKDGAVRFVFKVIDNGSSRSNEPSIVLNNNSLMVTSANNPNATPAYQASAQESKKYQLDDDRGPPGENLGLGGAGGSIEDFILNSGKFSGELISIQAKNEDIVNIINFISEEVGANIVISDSVKGTISIKLNQVPWDQALVVLMKSKGLGYVRNGNVLRVASLEELKKEALAAEEVKKAQKTYAPFHVKVFPLSYAKPSVVEEKIKPFLTAQSGEKNSGAESGQAISEERSSSIIVRDRLEVLKNVEKLIKELDRPPLQVMIAAKIVEASKTFTKEFSSIFNASYQVPSAGATALTAGGSINSSDEFVPRIDIRGIDFLGNLGQTLRLSELESKLKVLSSPSVMALNNEKALILQSDEVLTPQVVPQGGTVAPITTFTRDPVELRLEVTPQVSSDGNIIMDILVKRQTPGEENEGVRPIATREAATKVIVGNNKTAMIGGVYQTSETKSDGGTPVLRKIPLIKWLFSNSSLTKIDTELVIFLTPKVIRSPLMANDFIKSSTGLEETGSVSSKNSNTF